jgi:hypothetical protein
MKELKPEIGQLVKSLYAAEGETYWTEQMGMIVSKEPNPITKDLDYVAIFADGGLCWMGEKSMSRVWWPE